MKSFSHYQEAYHLATFPNVILFLIIAIATANAAAAAAATIIMIHWCEIGILSFAYLLSFADHVWFVIKVGSELIAEFYNLRYLQRHRENGIYLLVHVIDLDDLELIQF